MIMEIKTEDTKKLIDEFRDSGFDSTGKINVVAGEQSLTNGNRLEFVARFILGLTNRVPRIIQENYISIEFLEHPPDKLVIECDGKKARINVLDHQTGEPINNSVPKNGIQTEKSELIMGIMIAAYKIHTIDRMTDLSTHKKTRDQFRGAISSAEQAIDKAEF